MRGSEPLIPVADTKMVNTRRDDEKVDYSDGLCKVSLTAMRTDKDFVEEQVRLWDPFISLGRGPRVNQVRGRHADLLDQTSVDSRWV